MILVLNVIIIIALTIGMMSITGVFTKDFLINAYSGLGIAFVLAIFCYIFQKSCERD